MEDFNKIPDSDSIENKLNDKILFDNLDISVIIDFFRYMSRQGPGSEEITRRALSFIEWPADFEAAGSGQKSSTAQLRIADLGCGTGGQSITLALNTSAHITSYDNSEEMIETLQQRVSELGLQERIEGVVASMDNIPFDGREFDVIWAEGSIYNIGFERGLNLWREYLKDGGYVAVSDMVWLRDNRAAEIERYLNENVPEVETPSFKMRQIEEAGYVTVASFVLPECCWTDNYFRPMTALFDDFLQRHGHSEMAINFVKSMSEERDMYQKYSEYYGYMFFVAKKICSNSIINSGDAGGSTSGVINSSTSCINSGDPGGSTSGSTNNSNN
ncbi:MAG: class I SAM-dependent methyltransferase [Bacteroidales bacterium]|nr:class I SAM-dependent methyltransferase [Bacteroidales bacterium]